MTPSSRSPSPLGPRSRGDLPRPAVATPIGPDAERGWFAEWADGWNEFWFTPSDPLPLAVIRICTGVILSWACVVWLLDTDAFFGSRG